MIFRKRQLTVGIFALLTTVLLFSFQNCGKVNFAESQPSLSKSISSNNSTGSLAEVEDNCDKDKTLAQCQIDENDDKDHGTQKDNRDEKDKNSSKDDAQQTRFICVLEGHGRSIHLGFADNKFVAKNATPLSVCMTKYACESLVTKKLVVKSAEKTGFCKLNGNPHVIHMNDAELSRHLDQL